MFEPLVLILIALNCLLTLWGIRILGIQLAAAVGQIDSLVAQAIQKVLQGNLGDFEPPNPIQAAIGELLMNRVKDQQNIVDVTRDNAGKFTKD